MPIGRSGCTRSRLASARQFRNIDEFRHAIERIPAPIYLDSSYYERWLNAMMTLLVEKKKSHARGTRRARRGSGRTCATGRISFAAKRRRCKRRGARFREGDRVVARNINPTGHTRLPRYVRGKRGVDSSRLGRCMFSPTATRITRASRAQHVYSVSFDGARAVGQGRAARTTPCASICGKTIWKRIATTKAGAATKKSAPVARSKRGRTTMSGNHVTVPTGAALRVKALEAILEEKGPRRSGRARFARRYLRDQGRSAQRRARRRQGVDRSRISQAPARKRDRRGRGARLRGSRGRPSGRGREHRESP